MPVQSTDNDADREPSAVLASFGLTASSSSPTPGGRWVRARPAPSRSRWLLWYSLALVVAVYATVRGAGSWARAERSEQALQLVDRARDAILGGDIEGLGAALPLLERARTLVPEGREAARLLVAQRLLSVIVSGERQAPLAAALEAARARGVPAPALAFGAVGLALTADDLEGALQAVERWHGRAADDPLFLLVSGFTWERAGETQLAIQRYDRAFEREPRLALAGQLAARVVALELSPQLLGSPLQRYVPAALARSALSQWLATRGGDATRFEPSRPWTSAEIERLPVPYRPLPHLAQATLSARAGERAKALEALQSGLSWAVCPALVARFGLVALQVEGESVAPSSGVRQVVERVARRLERAPRHPYAAVFAARLHLRRGEYQQALAAVDELDPSAKDAAAVLAVLAYEQLDVAALRHHSAALGTLPEYEALRGATEVIGGSLVGSGVGARWGRAGVEWGRVVAADSALLAGGQDWLDTLFDGLQLSPASALAIRQVTWLRERGEIAKAYQLARALERAQPGHLRAVLEIAQTAALAGQFQHARGVIESGVVPAELEPWLLAYVEIAEGKVQAARGSVARLDLPVFEAALPSAVVVKVLKAVGDRRYRVLTDPDAG